MAESSTSTYVVDYSPEEVKKAHQVLYNEGLRMRIKVAGQDYVEKSLKANKDPFNKPMQEVYTPKTSLARAPDVSTVCCGGMLGLGVVTTGP